MRLNFYTALIAFTATTQIFSENSFGAQAINLQGWEYEEFAQIDSDATPPPKAGKGVKSTTLEDSSKTTYDPKKKERCLEMTKKVLHEFLDNGKFEEAVKLAGQ